jgi:hypothetical protein
MKNGVCLPPNQHDMIQPFIAASKAKIKLKAKIKTLQEKRIVREAIKI